MKTAILLLLLPLASLGQTVHLEEDEIVYTGIIKTPLAAQPEARGRGQQALAAVLQQQQEGKGIEQQGDTLKARGVLKLTTPHHLIRTVHYTLQLTAIENGYSYLIDSVYLQERVRGEEAKVRTAEQLLESLEDPGKEAIETEKLLNETDMRLQKVLALLRSKLEAPGAQ